MRGSGRPSHKLNGQGLELEPAPDWKNGDTYPQPEMLNDTFWRWEFLRRRSDYREDWGKYFQSTYEYDVACANDPNYPTRYRKKVFSPDHPAFKARMPNSLEKYHLSGLPNPKISKPWMLSFDSNYGRMYFGQGPDWLGGGEEVSLCLSEWRVAAVFDLKKPLPTQIEKVKTDLSEWQKHQVGRNLERRKCRDDWPLYLRVLDGVELGVSFREIGHRLLDINEDDVAEARIAQLYKQACQISLHFPV
jgi:hypothetical protein